MLRLLLAASEARARDSECESFGELHGYLESCSSVLKEDDVVIVQSLNIAQSSSLGEADCACKGKERKPLEWGVHDPMISI